MEENNPENVKHSILEKLFEDVDLEPILNTAIMKALNQEAKEKLNEGIMSYLSSQVGTYGSKTVLKHIFETSIHGLIQKRMTEIVQTDETVNNEIKRVINEATQRFLKSDKNELIDKLSSTFTEAFTRKYY